MWMIRHVIAILFPSSCIICKTRDEAVCRSCLKKAKLSCSSPFPFITSIFDYSDGTIRTAIRLMKYAGRKDIIEPLSHPVADKIAELPDCQSYLLVPVPMPLWRRLMRGYNQSEILAFHVGARTKLTVDAHLLKRSRAPGQQVASSGRRERLNNQKGTFACGDASGKRIILIDDVATTGSTLLEARRTLLSARAREVIAFVIAH